MVHVVVAAGGMGRPRQIRAARAADRAVPTETALGVSVAALADGADLVIAADSGADLLRSFGRLPHVLVGDLDSVTPATREACLIAGVETHELPATKDETDTEYALRLAVARGATRITILGALGGPRLDHLLANVFLLTAGWLAGCDVHLVDERFEFFVARGDALLRGHAGDLVSLLPLTAVVSDVETQGLAYPLMHEPLLMGASRGVSNVLLGTEAHIRHGEGILLVVHDHVATAEDL